MFIDLFEEEDSTIATERLTLRLLKDEDAEDLFEIRGDGDTAGDAGVPVMESIEEVREYIAQWKENSVAVVLGDEVIGLIESYSDKESMYNSVFLGYYMKRAHRNKGYMTEALETLKEEMFENGEPQLMLWIFPGNIASERVAEKCGWSLFSCRLVRIGGNIRFVDFYIQRNGDQEID